MQYRASLITADGAYHCPMGSIWPFFVLLLEKRTPALARYEHFDRRVLSIHSRLHQHRRKGHQNRISALQYFISSNYNSNYFSPLGQSFGSCFAHLWHWSDWVESSGEKPSAIITTEGALRLPTNYDNHPIQSHPSIYSWEDDLSIEDLI